MRSHIHYGCVAKLPENLRLTEVESRGDVIRKHAYSERKGMFVGINEDGMYVILQRDRRGLPRALITDRCRLVEGDKDSPSSNDFFAIDNVNISIAYLSLNEKIFAEQIMQRRML